MNDRLPLEGVLPMHCSANVGDDGRVAVFFGLSGTGKTTLSADPERSLIGDDEHGWGDIGVFNIEGGCYAKVIRLSAEAEPEICETTRTFGTILENVVDRRARRARPRRRLEDGEHARRVQARADLRTRCPTKRAGHPSAIVMLTADAFGILPPIARLTRDAGALLLPLRLHGEARRDRDRRHRAAADLLDVLRRAVPAPAAACYARMLGEKLAAHDATAWLVNTGWTGGPFGEGERMPIRRDARAAARCAVGRARRGRLPNGRCVRVRGADAGAGRRSQRCSIRAAHGAIPAAYDVQGKRARADVSVELREVRAGCAARGRGGRPARLAQANA